MQESKMFLYRYYSNKDYIIDVVANKRLYFCLPSEFNDPFDCKPLISINHSKCRDDSIWYKFLFYLAKTQYPDLPEAEVKKHADVALAKGLHKDPLWLRQINHHLKELAPMVRICCFSKSPRNMMMWAHYAKNHSGLLFQFRASGLHEQTTGSFRGYDVTYTPEAIGVKELINALEKGLEHNNPLEMARLFYCTKSNHWEMEKEVRFFSDKDLMYVSFDESTLSGIVFGDQYSNSLIDAILTELDNWRHKPLLFKVSIKNSAHKLWIGNY